MAKTGIRSRGSTRIEGPHGKGNSMLGKGVVARTAVRLRMQEALTLLQALLESVPLGLPLRPCEPNTQIKSECQRKSNLPKFPELLKTDV